MSEPTFLPAMRRAILLAQRGIPAAAPNPVVGAVLVRDGQVVAEGWHEFFGGPHAEINCLEDAARKFVNPAECVMVITLEPCNHYGKTPPCSQAILKAGIKHVVVGLPDPTPKAGGGAEFLRAHGVKVEHGPCPDECLALVQDFLFWQRNPLPFVTLKMACTLDGFVATRSGKSKWITSAPARERVHLLRARSQAVLIGGGTLHADNPLLSVRMDLSGDLAGNEGLKQMPGNPDADWLVLEKPRSFVQPMAVIASSRKLAPENLPRLVTERGTHTVFLTGAGSELAEQAELLGKYGVRVFEFKSGENGEFSPDNLRRMLVFLREKLNVWRVLSEGGSRFGFALLKAGLVQNFELHMAPCLLADRQAVNLFEGMAPDTIDEARKFLFLKATGFGKIGDDIILRFEPGE